MNRVDDVVCINLKERPDRKQHMMAQLDGIDFHFYHPTRHPNGGMHGCFESHINVISKAYSEGLNSICVFEDDIIANKTEHDLLNGRDKGYVDLVRFLRASPDGRPSPHAPTGWSILYLGSVPNFLRYSTSKVTTLTSGKVYKVNAVCLHAYIISRVGMERMKDWKYAGLAIDQLTVDFPDSYAYLPSLYHQGAISSDIDLFNPFVTHVRTDSMQLADWYTINVNIPIYTLIFILATLFVLVLVGTYIRCKR